MFVSVPNEREGECGRGREVWNGRLHRRELFRETDHPYRTYMVIEIELRGK
jgi:hypothetical protein